MGIHGVFYKLDMCLRYYRRGDFENALRIYREHHSVFRSLHLTAQLKDVIQALDTLKQIDDK